MRVREPLLDDPEHFDLLVRGERSAVEGNVVAGRAEPLRQRGIVGQREQRRINESHSHRENLRPAPRPGQMIRECIVKPR